MTRDYNVIEAVVIKKKGTIKFVNCDYKTLCRIKPTGACLTKRYDTRGNLIYQHDSSGFEMTSVYNKFDKRIRYNDNEGLEEWWEYDGKGNVTQYYYKDNDDTEILETYDSFGNVKHFKDFTTGLEEWHEYDERGNEIHFKDSIGCEFWEEYDENNCLLHRKLSNGEEDWYKAGYKVIHHKSTTGVHTYYDDNGNKVNQNN